MTIGERPFPKNSSIRLLMALAMFAATVFVMSTFAAAQEQVLYSFQNDGTDGIDPGPGLISDGAGNLYGTTIGGGAYNWGTVFELSPAAGGGWTEKVLYNFASVPDGANPYWWLIFDAAGNLYGTTFAGGTHNGGAVFELSPAAGGTWTEKVLYSFGNGAMDADAPQAGLIFDAAGNLYGTTEYGGTYYYGTVFELSPNGSGGWTEQVLHSFGNGADGARPFAGLIPTGVELSTPA
jgi:uncharacterized repeat protein (TIGR03803 family)